MTTGTASCPACGRFLGTSPGFRERKTVTVLYADLVGSTSVGERLDVESHQTLMTAYFDAMRHEVEALGGVVEQFVGDAVLAVFGVPVAREDDADRAIETGHRMLGRLADLNEGMFTRQGLKLEIRIGINTGEVLAPASGSAGVGGLAGDALNVAARLAGHADPGTILLSASTVGISRRWRFEPIGSIDLRGRDAPIVGFAVAGAVGGPVGVHALPPAPMTGRSRERATLDALRVRVESGHRPHLVTVCGPAGIGKSRLTAEFTADATVGAPPARVLFGRCRPYGEAVAFGALAEVLVAVAGIDEGLPAADAAARITSLVELMGTEDAPPPADAAEALAYVAGVAGRAVLAGKPAPQVRAAIGAAWKWLLERLSATGTVIVVIEDSHWADPALLDVLELLADGVEGPVLFVCPARPEFFDTRPAWGMDRSNFTNLLLDPLDVESGREVVEWYLGRDVERSIGAQIIARAEGNPYFIEEIIRGLIDQGMLEKVDSRWVVSGDVRGLHIPGTVQAVISARIDRLDSDQKRVLQCASVIGRTFWAGAVAQLLRVDRPYVEKVLRELRERDLVSADVDSVGSDEPIHRFKHALVRDVSYKTLSRRDRSTLHLALVDWLSRDHRTSSREVIALEAHHLALAYDGLRGAVGGDVDVGLLRIRAMEALLAASNLALRKAALGQAEYFARRARGMARSSIEASLAAEALGEAHFFGYRGDAAWEALKEAIDLRLEDEEEGPDPDIARLCARALLITVRWPGAMQSRPDEVTVLRYLHVGMDHAPPQSEDDVRLLTLRGFWQHAFPRPDDDVRGYLITPEESLRSSELAVAASRDLGRPDLESAALDAVAGYYIPRGFYAAAGPHTRRRLELIDDLEDLWEIGDTYAMQGWVEFHLGNYRRAEEWSSVGYARTVAEAPSLALQCLRWRTAARFRLGDWDGVRRDLAIIRDLLGADRDDPPDYVSPAFAVAALVHEYRGERVLSDSILNGLEVHFESRSLDDRDPLPLSQWAEFAAPILVRRGRRTDARRLLARSVWRRRARMGLILEAWLEVASEAGNWDDAPALLDEARTVAAEGGLRSLSAAADAFEGRLLKERGDLEGSIAKLEEAASGFGTIGAVWDAARARLDLAEALELAGFDVEAQKAVTSSLSVFKDLRARREIDAAAALVRSLNS